MQNIFDIIVSSRDECDAYITIPSLLIYSVILVHRVSFILTVIHIYVYVCTLTIKMRSPIFMLS